jgi:hypothetical protein
LSLNRQVAFNQAQTGFVARRLPASAARVVIVVALAFSLFGMTISGSPLTVLAGGLSLSILLFTLWQIDVPPIMLIPALYQWVQVAIKPFLTIVYAKPIDQVLDAGGGLWTNLEPAAVFGFSGISCLAIGLWIGSGRPRVNLANALRMEARAWNLKFVLRLAIGAIIIGHTVNAFAGLAGSALQLVLPFAGLAYCGIFVLAYWCLVNKTGYRYLAAIMIFEIVIGLTGFFADFRGPVLVLAMAALTARPSVRFSNVVILTGVAAVILCVATFWSAVKNDYRTFVNEGTGAQSANVPFQDRLNYIINAAAAFDGEQFSEGFQRLLARQSYIDFLGATLSNVPKFVPHEDGMRSVDAIENMIMPRFLFPNKPALQPDTVVTAEYTGLSFTADEYTSISIGYLGELYIDFGYFGALIAALILGAMVGVGYRTIRDYERLPRIVTFGMCAMAALPLEDFGTSLVKTVNGTVLTFGAVFVIQRVIAPRAMAYFAGRSRQRSVRRNLR